MDRIDYSVLSTNQMGARQESIEGMTPRFPKKKAGIKAEGRQALVDQIIVQVQDGQVYAASILAYLGPVMASVEVVGGRGASKKQDVYAVMEGVINWCSFKREVTWKNKDVQELFLQNISYFIDEIIKNDKGQSQINVAGGCHIARIDLDDSQEDAWVEGKAEDFKAFLANGLTGESMSYVLSRIMEEVENLRGRDGEAKKDLALRVIEATVNAAEKKLEVTFPQGTKPMIQSLAAGAFEALCRASKHEYKLDQLEDVDLFEYKVQKKRRCLLM